MTDSRILPGARAKLVNPDGTASRDFYVFFRQLEEAGVSAEQIRELCIKLGSPDGTIANIPDNPGGIQSIIGQAPILAAGNTVSLASLAQTVGGELVGVTVDGFGRVSQARPVVPGAGIEIDGTTDPTQIEIVNSNPNVMTTLGDIITGGASGAPQRLGVGAAGQVLTVVSGAPAWAAPSGGGSLNVQDEGSTVVTGATAINFVGAGVTATAAGSVATVTIPGGGGSSPYIAPPQTGWSWVNQGGASIVDTASYQAITGGAAGSGANLRIRVRTLSPTSNYTLTTALQITILRKSFISGGIILRNSSTGALVLFDVIGASEMLLRTSRFNSATSFNADYQAIGIPLSDVIWLRIQDNGTNRIFSWSIDGDLWNVFFTVGRTDFTTPDQIGFFSGVENSGTPNIAPIVKLISWQIV